MVVVDSEMHIPWPRMQAVFRSDGEACTEYMDLFLFSPALNWEVPGFIG